MFISKEKHTVILNKTPANFSGADASIRNKENKTALQLTHDTDTAAFLKQASTLTLK